MQRETVKVDAAERIEAEVHGLREVAERGVAAVEQDAATMDRMAGVLERLNVGGSGIAGLSADVEEGMKENTGTCLPLSSPRKRGTRVVGQSARKKARGMNED